MYVELSDEVCCNIFTKKYMYVELSDEVCCNIFTANKHIEISI